MQAAEVRPPSMGPPRSMGYPFPPTMPPPQFVPRGIPRPSYDPAMGACPAVPMPAHPLPMPMPTMVSTPPRKEPVVMASCQGQLTPENQRLLKIHANLLAGNKAGAKKIEIDAADYAFLVDTCLQRQFLTNPCPLATSPAPAASPAKVASPAQFVAGGIPSSSTLPLPPPPPGPPPPEATFPGQPVYVAGKPSAAPTRHVHQAGAPSAPDSAGAHRAEQASQDTTGNTMGDKPQTFG